jgi:putative intracellular protease/amidase
MAVAKRVLMMIIPERQIPADVSGSRSEIIASYYLLQDSGFEVVLAAPTEEAPWTWRDSNGQDALSPSHHRLREDQAAQDAFADMLAIQQICVDDFAAAICIGTSIVPSKAGGPHDAPTLANAMLAAGKPVAVIASADVLHPIPAGNGLLIVGSSKDAHLQAARSLIRLMEPRDQRHGA